MSDVRRFLAIMLALPMAAQAAPFLVTDPDPNGWADLCVLSETDGSAETALDTVAFACRVDLGAMPAGAYTWNIWFRSTSQKRDSDKFVGFTFTLPLQAFPKPAGVRVVP